MPELKIRRALIAVHDKTGIADFARALVDEFGIEIISTGGTAKHLKEHGIPVTLVEQVTGFPEMLDGRVKTLHPKIHAGILADRDNPEHMRQLAEQGIQPIDLVVVNLYPFEKTVADPNCSFEDAIEMIDIGGPCLLRAAAKNHKHVWVVSKPVEYSTALDWMRDPPEGTLAGIRRDAAWGVFWTTSLYDAAVAEWLKRQFRSAGPLGRAVQFLDWGSLRYGENPHQTANLLRWWQPSGGTDLTTAEAGLPDQENWQHRISFNNYVDADAALGLCAELSRTNPALWHRFPTGVLCDRFVTGHSSKRPITKEHQSRRNLPHIQKPGSTYFVTFRLLRGELSEDERDIVLSTCRFWHEKKMTLHSVVVMPDHVHMLMTPHESAPGQWMSLGEILHSVKRFSSNEINKKRGQQGALWLDESFDRIVRDEKEFIEKWDYVEANPVTAGIVLGGHPYRWFWASGTGFQETIRPRELTKPDETPAAINTNADNHLLETSDTGHRLETGATAQGPAAVESQTRSICVFIKHTNACGVGIADEPIEAYRRAYVGDPNAAMGGILAVNFSVDVDFAAVVMETYDRFGRPLREAGAPYAPGGFFVEVWIAPRFDDDAVKIIRTKKKWGESVRLLAVGDMTVEPDPKELDYKRIAGGMLVQTRDLVGLNEEQWKVVTKRAPTDEEMADLRLAWLICKHTKSNAISLVRDGMLIGNGAGQMSRVMSCRIATWLAKENGHADKLPGSVAASDAFFPFRDGPDILIDAGVTAIIQPGGSKRDAEVVAACDARGVAMIFTGTRHFRH